MKIWPINSDLPFDFGIYLPPEDGRRQPATGLEDRIRTENFYLWGTPRLTERLTGKRDPSIPVWCKLIFPKSAVNDALVLRYHPITNIITPKTFSWAGERKMFESKVDLFHEPNIFATPELIGMIFGLKEDASKIKASVESRKDEEVRIETFDGYVNITSASRIAVESVSGVSMAFLPPAKVFKIILEGQIVRNGQLFTMPTLMGEKSRFRIRLCDSDCEFAVVSYKTRVSVRREQSQTQQQIGLQWFNQSDIGLLRKMFDCIPNPNYKNMRRQILLTGSSGVGKTKLVSDLCSHYGFKLCKFDIQTILKYADNSDFIKPEVIVCKKLRRLFDPEHSDIDYDRPPVILLDNIESLFPLKRSLNSAVLAKELLHANRSGNPFIIGTTSSMSDIDPCIRKIFAHAIELNPPEQVNRIKILQHFFDKLTLNEDSLNLEDLALRTQGMTFPDLQSLCQRLAFKQHSLQRPLNPTEIDRTFHEVENQSTIMRRALGVYSDMVIDYESLGIDPDTAKSNIAAFENFQPELYEIINDLQSCLSLPSGFRELPFDGILFYGPPGTGKTHIAKIIAHFTRSKFFRLSIPQLVRAEIGEGEKALSQAFKTARKSSPCILFLDEIDAIFGGDKSTSPSGHGSDVLLRRLMCQLMVEMDALRFERGHCGENDGGVLLVAATNIPFVLDKSILRRIDKCVHVSLPTVEERIRFLLQNLLPKMQKNVDNERILPELASKKMERYSRADLQNFVNQAISRALFQTIGQGDEVQVFNVFVTAEDIDQVLLEARALCDPILLQRYTDWAKSI